jgi:ACS family hexuronate transporter-like MFS transporter
VWVVVWLGFYSQPREHRGVSAAELAWIESDKAEEGATTRIPWLALLRLPQTWSFVLAKFMTDPVWFFLLIWLPDYFKKTRDLDIKHSWPLLVTVYSVVTILSIGGGWITGYLVRTGWSVTRARKTGMFCFALLVVPILAVGAVGNWSANLMTTVSDMFPKRDIGSVIGLGSTGGAMGSMIFIYLCGWIVQHAGGNGADGYHILFIYCACAYLVAFGLNHLLARRFEPIVRGNP